MTEERSDLHLGRRTFSNRIARRIIIISNRLERQRENLKKKEYPEADRYVPFFQKRLFDCVDKDDK